MNTEEFDFPLDPELIAQHPAKVRDHCKLLQMDRKSGALTDREFYEIADILQPGDTLILNDTKVMPARLFGARPGHEEKIEVLLLKQREIDLWECLVKPGKKLKIGTEVRFSDELSCVVEDILDDGQRVVRMKYEGVFEEILDRLGNMPLPPYITAQLDDNDDYQTVYAKVLGSAAAPTAGLHFTEELLDTLREKGVNIGFVTLHVGLGTFRPVKVDDVTKHHMHSEFYILSEETADLINQTKARGNRVVAVGTTSTRTLESVYQKRNEICADSGWTDIFIYPGFEYKVIDGLITNFHLPKSTLIMMVSAFSSKAHILEAYRIAQEKRYRFFSFGDAMIII